jgi:hypothetical protein
VSHQTVGAFCRQPVTLQPGRPISSQRFTLSVEQWQAFQAAMDQPLKTLPKLRKLLSEPGVLG